MTKGLGRTQAIKVGDTVAYRAAWLRGTATYAGDLAQAGGKVLAPKVVSPDVTLADIEWDQADLPAKVNVKNLCRVKERGFGA